MQHCLRHMEEPSTAQCRNCQGTYCNRCLVFSFGPRKPPYCVGCALHASGVRPGSRKVIVPPPPAPESAMDPSFGNPVAFDDASNHGEGPSDPPGGASARRSPRGSRRARRQAEKEAARATPSQAETGGLSVADSPPLGAEALQPVLAPAERRLLSRLTANRLAQV